MEKMESQVCVDCSKRSPETDTNYTLISAQHGWRLHRVRRADGSFDMEWRCPDCWRRFKAENGLTSSHDLSAHRPPSSGASPATHFARATRRLQGKGSEPPPGRG